MADLKTVPAGGKTEEKPPMQEKIAALKAAENVFRSLEIQERQNLIVLYDGEAKRRLVDALAARCGEKNAHFVAHDVSILSMGGSQEEVAKKLVEWANGYYGDCENLARNMLVLVGDGFTGVRRGVIRALKDDSYILNVPTTSKEITLTMLGTDPEEVSGRGKRMQRVLEGAKRIRITSPAGTDVEFDWGDGRRWPVSDGLIKRNAREAGEKGRWGNPPGEIFSSPVETTVRGVVVFDGTISELGMPKEPLKIYVGEGGKADLTRIEGDAGDITMLIMRLSDKDGKLHVGADLFGEIGFGLMRGKMTGDILFDEKLEGTVHMALGDSEGDRTGGKNKSPAHTDGLIKEPTVEVDYGDGKWIIVMGGGEWVAA